MADKPNDLYGTMGSVPQDTPEGGGGSPINVDASPEAFGGQVGAAVQNVGKQAADITQQYSGMINETLATDAETQYVEKLGSLTGDFKSQSGLNAVNALPAYTQSVADLRQQYRSSLPINAAHAFDTLALRHEGFAIGDANSYAASQVKQADRASALNGLAMSQTMAASPSVANDDTQFNNVLGDIQAHTDRIFSNAPGITQNPKTGQTTFADTPEGQQTKTAYENQLNAATGQAWINRFIPLANANVQTAYQKYQDDKDNIPGPAQVQLNAYFAPKVINSNINAVHDTVINGAAQQHYQSVASPDAMSQSSTGSYANNIGNIKTAQAAADGTTGFMNFATPADGVTAAANLLQKNYRGLTLAQIANKWAPPSENKTSDWLSTVSKISGIAPDATPDMTNPNVLKSLISGIGTAEKSSSDRAQFTPEVIDQGVTESLAGQQPKEADGPPNAKPLYPQPPQSIADYYRVNYSQILQNTEQKAAEMYPGDPQFQDAARAKVEQTMNDTIRQQEMSYKADADLVMQAVNGSANGVRPTTVEQMTGVNADVSAAWDRTMVNNPQFAEMVQNRLLTANAKGIGRDQQDYGSPFTTVRQKIMSGQIYSPQQLMPYIAQNDTDESSGKFLSQKGIDKAMDLMKVNPEELKIQSAAFDAIKTQFSVYAGQHDIESDPKGQIAYDKAVPLLYQAWNDGKSKGYTTAELSNPESSHWVGLATKALWLSDTQKAINALTSGQHQAPAPNAAPAAEQQNAANLQPGGNSDNPAILYQKYKMEPDQTVKEAIKQRIMKLQNLKDKSDNLPTAPVSQ